VFFFDEAHLLFADAPKALIERIELVVRLVRSKGVGVFFVTQNPLDIPDTVLAQLGNRVQHALRAFTPRDQKAVKSAAETMRQNPQINIETAITELGVGEALISFLDEKGRPGITERVYVLPPGSQIGPITAEQRKDAARPVHRRRRLREGGGPGIRLRSHQGSHPVPDGRPGDRPAEDRSDGALDRPAGRCARRTAGPRSRACRILRRRQPARLAGQPARRRPAPVPVASAGEQLIKSAASAVGREVGRQIIRGVLGGIFGGKR
jgi:hypothetical protein